MKKIWKYFWVFIVANLVKQSVCVGQFTLEHVYNVPPGKQFYFTDLGNNNYKYLLIDYYNNYFSLYNLDNSPYILNIIPGVPLDSGHIFTIAYITSTLFDCDSTNIEYAITAVGVATKPFYVFRTDGTLLFSKDSVVGPYCIGCFGGSRWFKPVFNTPVGTKMLLANFTTNDWFLYSLCGTLPETVDQSIEQNQYVKLYPNPSSGMTIMEIDLMDNLENYELNIYNSLLKSVRKESIRGSKTLTIDNNSLSSGVYFFSLQTTTKIIQTGKFVITK
ncbi:MAG: T9SS type A sorting domain-containing protein [Bacteroidota bacterium]